MTKKALTAVSTIFILLLIIVVPCQAEDGLINACYKKNNGQLRIVSDPNKCLKSELPISWNQTGQDGPPGVSGSIKVFDNNGQYLGIGLGSIIGVAYADIYIPSLNVNIKINYRSGDTEETYMLFESSDCSGSPYIYCSATYYIFKNGSSYYIGERLAPLDIYIRSHLKENGACEQSNHLASGLVPASLVQLPFNLPVALPLRFEY